MLTFLLICEYDFLYKELVQEMKQQTIWVLHMYYELPLGCQIATTVTLPLWGTYSKLAQPLRQAPIAKLLRTLWRELVALLKKRFLSLQKSSLSKYSSLGRFLIMFPDWDWNLPRGHHKWVIFLCRYTWSIKIIWVLTNSYKLF